MTTPDYDRAGQRCTAEHAENLQKAIHALVKDKEPQYRFSSYVGVNCESIYTPAEIDTHLPLGGLNSHDVRDSAYIKFELERGTREPRSEGLVGMVSFTRSDEVVKGVIYAGHVNYHITHNDGVFGLERHVTNTEHGQHMVKGALGQTARHAVDPLGQLMELLDLKARLDESRPIEAAMGMFDVSASEAEAIITFVQNAQ